MTSEAFVVDDRKLTPEELKQMLSDTFESGYDSGFNEALRAAKRDVMMAARAGDHIRVIEDLRIRGINLFDTAVGFEKYLKQKGGRT